MSRVGMPTLLPPSLGAAARDAEYPIGNGLPTRRTLPRSQYGDGFPTRRTVLKSQ
jgi:hypothetical protein